MFPQRPRLRTFDYLGTYRYFLTCCTAGRCHWFDVHSTVAMTLSQIRRSAACFEIELLAWCFMPDHLHLLCGGMSERSEFRRFVKDFKQRTGHAFARRTAGRLWQPSFYERVLRDGEATEEVVRYILANPVRTGLVREPLSYPHSGSDVYRLDEVLKEL
jgi:putative transposase